MNVPIFLEKWVQHWACHQGTIWSALSDAVETGVQNGMLTGTIKWSWWTFSNFMKWNIDPGVGSVAPGSSLCNYPGDQNKPRPSDEFQVHTTPYFLFFSSSQTHLNYFSFCHILLSLKFWCSCHFLSICIKSCRMRISSLRRKIPIPIMVPFQEMLSHQWSWYGKDQLSVVLNSKGTLKIFTLNVKKFY